MDLPRIEHYLTAFITPDNHHPTKNMTIEKVPYPYSHLESIGALVESDAGLNMLGYVASRKVGNRPLGGLPYCEYGDQWGSLKVERRGPIVTAQTLLIKYGHLMVEKKMLLP